MRLNVSEDGVAQARLIAERPEALAELTRNARALERALEDAGVDIESGGLSFELAEDAHTQDGDASGDQPGFADTGADGDRGDAAAADRGAPAEIDTAYGFSVMRRMRMDVRV